MIHNARSRAWICAAVVYFCIGVALGVMMGATGDHSLAPLHAHINLLGWVSMSLFGVIGAVYPVTTQGPIATAQFWIHNLGLPVLLVALGARLKGHDAVDPISGWLRSWSALACSCSPIAFLRPFAWNRSGQPQ